MYPAERRKMDRYELPGAWVMFRYGQGPSRAGVLKDISFSAVCFKSEKSFEPGISMDVVISIPGIEDIFVKGTVIRAAQKSIKNIYNIVVQFMLFGTDPRYNSITSYNQLKNLNENLMQGASN
jgi:hypothetical protein